VKTLLIFLMVTLGIMAASAGSYIAGRIVLPEMGLVAPGYGTWFWATLFTMAAVVAVHVCSGVIKAAAE
jgi:hypothetical protein